jgi:uncharacterized protein (TIGR02145 family)
VKSPILIKTGILLLYFTVKSTGLKIKNMRKKTLCLLVFALPCFWFTALQAQLVKDTDGNVYASTTIGKQIWMVENLKTTKYNDGTPIPLVTNDKAWQELKSPAYCWLNNDIKNKEIYGALYNWYTVKTKKLCPKGWHVPSNDDWIELTIFLGDKETAGAKLKESGSTHWKNPLNVGTNDFDFTGLPGGLRLVSGLFPEFGTGRAVWWSSTGTTTDAWNRGLSFDSDIIFKGDENVRYGFSVRCLKDK